MIYDEIERCNALIDYVKSHYFPFVFQKMLVFLNKKKSDKAVNLISCLILKIKEKKIVSRWNNIIHNYANKKLISTPASGKRNINNKKSSSSENSTNHKSKINKTHMSPELHSSNILSPPFFPQYVIPNYLNHQGVRPMFPITPINIIGNYLPNKTNNENKMIGNPLNKFRPVNTNNSASNIYLQSPNLNMYSGSPNYLNQSSMLSKEQYNPQRLNVNIPNPNPLINYIPNQYKNYSNPTQVDPNLNSKNSKMNK